MINTAANDAAEIVRRLREFYRIRDEDEIFQPVNLNRLIEQTVSLTQPKWRDQAQANNIHINIEMELQEIPLVAGKESELREMLTNLIFNAVDAIPKSGTISLRTYFDDEHVVLEVSDTGTGMTEDVRRRCLEPFFSTKGERGTGLGLSMVYGIVQRHEGTIEIKSQFGVGTTFQIRLPISTKQKIADRKQQKVVPLHPLYVLVVDDEPAIRNLISHYLFNLGHIVETATNGIEGLEKFRAGKFDLVLTDRAMPELSGNQLAPAVKQINPNVPVILLTGFGEMMKAEGEQPVGVDLIVNKPVDLPTLEEALAKVKVK